MVIEATCFQNGAHGESAAFDTAVAKLLAA